MKSNTPESHFGKELETLRNSLTKKTGETWSQKKVADAIGVTTQAYQNWVHGRRGKNIELVTIKKLSEVLDADFFDLVKLGRPDIFELLEVSKNKIVKRHRKDRIIISDDHPPDLIYIAKIIKILYKEDIKEFDKIKRILIDFYPDHAEKSKKSDK